MWPTTPAPELSWNNCHTLSIRMRSAFPLANFSRLPATRHPPIVLKYKEAPAQLVSQKEIEIISPDGNRRVKASTIREHRCASSCRSLTVNEWGHEKGHSCASNKNNFAGHIWDEKDDNGKGCNCLRCCSVVCGSLRERSRLEMSRILDSQPPTVKQPVLLQKSLCFQYHVARESMS